MKSPEISWYIYFRNGIGKKLSRFGELVALDWLIYNPLFILQINDEANLNAIKVVSAMLDVLPSSVSFLDVGCGSGSYSYEIKQRGLKVIGLEKSWFGKILASNKGVDCRSFDLNKSPPATLGVHDFDVVFCFEVAEHLSADLGEKLVEFIASFKSIIIFSAAQPGQGGTGHINERPIIYWIDKFEKYGFIFDKKLTNDFRRHCINLGTADWFKNNPFIMQMSD